MTGGKTCTKYEIKSIETLIETSQLKRIFEILSTDLNTTRKQSYFIDEQTEKYHKKTIIISCCSVLLQNSTEKIYSRHVWI